MSTQRYSGLLRRALSFDSSNPNRILRHNRPPNPPEHDAILGLIEEDNAFISLLEEQLALRKRKEEDELAMVYILELEVKEAEERLKTAKELHEFFQQTDNKLHRIKQTPSPPSTPISSVGSFSAMTRRHSNMDMQANSITSVRSFDTLLKMTTSYNDSTKAALESSAAAVEAAIRALENSRHELQATLTVTQMRHDDVRLMQDQVRVLKEASLKKRAMFRSIWRIPEEVWRDIFIEAATSDNGLEISEKKNQSTNQSGEVTAVLLSLVCHNWRIIAHSTPQLWNSITIPNLLQPKDIQRIKHYYSLCHKSQLDLTLTMFEPTSTAFYQHIQRIFDASIPGRTMKCFVRSAGIRSLNALLPCLPPPLELHINRPTIPTRPSSPASESTPQPLIPANYCRTIETLHIFAAGADWADERSLHLRRYTIIAPSPSAIYGPHQFVPSSMESLKVIGIEGRFVDLNQTSSNGRVMGVLENLEETVMGLAFLVNVFAVHYRLPALRKLTITGVGSSGSVSGSLTLTQWERFLMGLQREIEEVECMPISKSDMEVNGIEMLVSCLRRVKTMGVLTLRGESVDPVLRGLSHSHKTSVDPKTRSGTINAGGGNGLESVLPALHTLVIDGYTGDGEILVVFLEKKMTTDPIGELKVALRGCTRIRSEVLTRLSKIVTLIH